MVRIRLRRVGKRKQPSYRVVVADQRSPRDGRFIEIIGQYHPLEDPSGIEIEGEKALEWLRKGAQPSASVKALLKRSGVWSEFVKDKGPAPKPPKRKKRAARLAAEAAAAAPAEEAPAAVQAPVAVQAPAAEEAPAQDAPAEEAPAEDEA